MREGGPLWVDGPFWRDTPRVTANEFLERAATNGAVTTDGTAERNGCAHGDVSWDPKQSAQFVFDPLLPHRDDAAITQRSRRKQQILNGRIDRSSFGWRWCAMAPQARDDDNRCFLEVFNEMSHGGGHPCFRRVTCDSTSRLVSVGLALLGPDRPCDCAEKPFGLARLFRVGQHHKMKALTV